MRSSATTSPATAWHPPGREVGSMTQALLCMSHSPPLLDHANPPADTKTAVEAAFEQARTFVKDFDPELIVNFGPDHYNGFFYDLMPPFCLATTRAAPATTTRTAAKSMCRPPSPRISPSSSSTAESTWRSHAGWRSTTAPSSRWRSCTTATCPRSRSCRCSSTRWHGRSRRCRVSGRSAEPSASTSRTWTGACCSSDPAASPTTLRFRSSPPPPKRSANSSPLDGIPHRSSEPPGRPTRSRPRDVSPPGGKPTSWI